MDKIAKPVTEVFAPEALRALGLEYKDAMVRTANKMGYMRNFLCEASMDFCSQSFSPNDRVLEIGSGIGAVLKTLIDHGATQIWAVDSEQQHLSWVRHLLAPTLAQKPE